MKKFSFLIALILLVGIAGAPSSSFSAQPNVESMYQSARSHYYALFSGREKLNDPRAWNLVIRKFQNIVKTRPSSKRGRDATYTLGLLYEKWYRQTGKNEYKERSVFYFRRVIRNYPKSTLVDDAQRHIGDIRFNERDYVKARSAYNQASSRQNRPAGRSNHGDKTVLTSLTDVKTYSRDKYTRVVLYLSAKTAYHSQKLSNPDRIFIDLLDTKTSSGVPKTIRLKKGTAGSIRVAQNRSKVARVALDMKYKDTYYDVSSLNNPFRIVIDVGRNKVATSKKPAPQNRAVVKSKPSTSRIRTIVLDPGHGGKDPGAIGRTGLREKDVTLSIAKKLKPILERRLGCRVILTRKRDKTLALDERTVIANANNADLFISIHVNASRNRKARGLETYFLSPARSEDELDTAARENMLSLKSSSEVENDLAYIMSDLTNTSKVNDSATLAGAVQRSLVKGMRRSYSGVKDKGVKQAMFYVLWRATMPSALVETGFITSLGEEKRLRSSKYIDNLANSIANGVIDYNRTYKIASAF